MDADNFRPQPPRAARANRRRGVYEYRTLTFDRKVSRADIRQALTDEAEYGQWELSRTRIYIGGLYKVELRRRVMRFEQPVHAGLL